MKIAKHTNSKKRIVIYALITLVLLGGSYAAFAFTHKNSSTTPTQQEKKETINTDPPTASQITQGQNIKKDSIDQATSQAPTQDISITLISSNKNDTTVQLRTLINKNMSNGTCVLSVSQINKSYTDTVTVQNMPSTSTCRGFDIPLNRLSQGSWTGTIRAQDESGAVAEINVSFDV